MNLYDDHSFACDEDGGVAPIRRAFVCPLIDSTEAPSSGEVYAHLQGEGIPISLLLAVVRSIHTILDGNEWNSDTFAAIADVFASAGFPLANCDEYEDEPAPLLGYVPPDTPLDRKLRGLDS
jgi:hypothetical protein